MQLRANQRTARPAATVVELAVLLPLLAFLFVIGVDFARLFYHLVTVTNAARSGAAYGAQDPVKALDGVGIVAAALNDSKNLSPPPAVVATTGVDALGYPCVNVTVAWTFRTVTRFPGVADTVLLSRTVQMRIAPKQPVRRMNRAP